MSSRKYILEISVLIILALLLYGCVREEEASYLPIKDTAVYDITEQIQMDCNSEFEKLLAEKGFQTGTLPGLVEFCIDKADIFDSPEEAGIADLHGTCQEELKPSTDNGQVESGSRQFRAVWADRYPENQPGLAGL